MKIAAWISAAIAVLMIICGFVDYFFVNCLFGVFHPGNYFIVATTFLLLAIFCKMMECKCCEKDKK
jgi:hypothetical protein